MSNRQKIFFEKINKQHLIINQILIFDFLKFFSIIVINKEIYKIFRKI